jgi:hypothetical protein
MPDLGDDPPALDAFHEAEMVDENVGMNPQPDLHGGSGRRKPIDQEARQAFIDAAIEAGIPIKE